MSLPSHIARYTVVQPIAAGGMGEVFLARDEKLDRLVAIKLLREGFDSVDLHQRFEEEARNVAKLTHPNIVTIYEFGAHEGRPYIAMEYIAGHSLAEIVKRQLPISVARRVRLIEEVCSGLAHAHKAHLVHRDVKPANLMMTTSGLVKVLDFGIAKLRGTDRTQKGMIVGTVNYMSPEQITGQPVDHRSDVFAVGAVLYELLTYEQAFKGDLTTAMFAIVHGHPDPLAVRCPGLDPSFQTVVDKCLAKSPDDRYQDLSQLKKDLGRLRRPLEAAEDADVSDTVAPLDVDQTIVVRALKPASSVDGRGVGPDTRRALGSALAAGEAAMTSGQFESAIRYAEQALALESQNISAQDLMSRAVKARDDARAASEMRLAREALSGDRLDDARAALEAATALVPDSNTVRELLKQVEARAADLDRFDRTVVLARERFEAHDFGAARDLAATAAVIRPDHSALRRLQHDIERADATFKAWLTSELAAIDALASRQAFDEALARAEAAAAQAPQAAEFTARASRMRAERDRAAEAEAVRRREEDDRRRAEADRAARIAALIEKAQRTTEGLPARRQAAAELMKLEPQHALGAALLAELTAQIEAAARQRALDELAKAAETLLEQGQFDAAEAKARELAKAGPEDARTGRLQAAIAERRQRQAQTKAAVAAAESAAAAGRHAEAIAALERLDTRDPAVAPVLQRVRRQADAAARRQRTAALQARVMGVATDWRAMSGLGMLAAVSLAVWLWPSAPTPAPGQTSTTVATDDAPAPAAEAPAVTDPAPAPAADPPARDERPEPRPGTATANSGPAPATTTPTRTVPDARPGPANPVANEAPPKPLEPPPAVPTRPRIVSAGADVPAPARTRYVEPVYPSRALAERAQGVVTAEITVGVDGAVTGTSIRRSIPALDAAAVMAIRQWRYQPSTKDGQPVIVRMTVDVPFKLPAAVETRTAEGPGTNPTAPAKEDTRAANTAPPPPAEKPALEKPAPPPPAPKVDEGAALRQADQAALNSLVRQFGNAYQGESLAAMKAAWPEMPRDAESGYRSVFQSYSRLGWSLQNAESSFNADRTKATTICNVQVALTELRGNATRTERRSYRFSFERRPSGWTLVNVENLGAIR